MAASQQIVHLFYDHTKYSLENIPNICCAIACERSHAVYTFGVFGIFYELLLVHDRIQNSFILLM